MKVVLISQNASPGIVIFRKNLVVELLKSGCQVYCFAIDYDDRSRGLVEGWGAVPVDYSFSRTGLNPFRDLKDTWTLFQKIKKLKPDLVFSFFAKPVIFGSLASKLARVPKRIGMIEGLGFSFTEQPVPLSIKTRLIRWAQVQLYRVAIPFLDEIIFLNSDDPVDLIVKYGIKAKKVSVLGGIGLDLNEYCYVKPKSDVVRFIFVGRLLVEKGVYQYIDAAKMVKHKYPEVEFVMLGGLDEGNPGGVRRYELEKLSIDNVIICPGHVENVPKWIANSSVFVLPSYREGVPRSTQEAMAIGRAVITTDAPGCRETVVNGVNGFIVPKWDTDALAEAMIKFVENPDLISRMGMESFRLAQEKFDVEVVNKKLMGLLGFG